MCNFYKNASKLFYQFGKVCLIGGGLAIFYGMFYLINIFINYEEYEIGDILSDFIVLHYIACCALAIALGVKLMEKYTDYTLSVKSKDKV
jgi:hypothetical protein